MSFGLNNILKKILPTGLFYRSLIIVAAPTIILQIIITVVFFDSIWIKSNKGLTRSLVGEIKTLSDIYASQNEQQIQYLTDQFKYNFDFVINIKNEELPEINKERKYSPIDRSLRRELKSVFGSTNYWFDTTRDRKSTRLTVHLVCRLLLEKTDHIRLVVRWWHYDVTALSL